MLCTDVINHDAYSQTVPTHLISLFVDYILMHREDNYGLEIASHSRVKYSAQDIRELNILLKIHEIRRVIFPPKLSIRNNFVAALTEPVKVQHDFLEIVSPNQREPSKIRH